MLDFDRAASITLGWVGSPAPLPSPALRPDKDNIAAPPIPGRRRWHNVDKDPVLLEATAAGPVLFHFFDFAQLNSVRALPYVIAWDERYRDAGLTTLGVHSPRFAFTKRSELLKPALERLGVTHPVVDDSDYALWHDYGCEGWPSLFLWAQGGSLSWFHFGEGEYAATELAIAAELARIDSTFEPLPALEPLRASDAPDARVVPPTPEVLPGGSVSEPWRYDGKPIEADYGGGGAYVTVEADEPGEIRVAIDGGPPRTVTVAGAGLVELASHPRHEQHSLRLEADPHLALYSVSFSAGVP